MNLKKFLPLLASAIFFMPAQSFAAPMTLSVHDADLRATIMLVAKTGGLNVSVDDSVKGSISISVGAAIGNKAFAATVLGGIGVLKGAVVGGYILAIIESFVAGYWSMSAMNF